MKPLDLSEYAKLRREAELQRREADRAAGALGQFRSQVKELYGCETPDELEREIAEREVRLLEREGKVETVVTKFVAKYGELLRGVNHEPEPDEQRRISQTGP